MARESGWIKLHRKITEHWIWEDPVKLKMWLDLILLVNHEDKKVNIGMQLVDCKRGQTITSLSKLSIRWMVSREVVRGFLNALEAHTMINTLTNTRFTQITICNYDSYNEPSHTKHTHNNTPTDTTKEYKEYKETNNTSNEDIISKEKTQFQKFQSWVYEELPNVSKLKKQVTEDNFNFLIEEYGKQAVINIFRQMENKADLTKKYTSAYLTANAWLKRAKNDGK